MIDLHLHILPGLDDGPATLGESVALARASVADGVRIAAATPHVRDDYPTTADAMEQGVADLRAALREADVPLDVRPGAEVALDRLGVLSAAELRRLRLGGETRYVLVEFPYYGWPLSLAADVAALGAGGMTAVLAHPERNGDVQADPERLREVVEQGALVQLTAASLDGRLGRRSRAAAFELLERSLAHLLASDAHGPEVRDAGLASAANALGDESVARWLTADVPDAMLADEPLPARPERPRAPGRTGLVARLRRGRS